MNTVEFVELVVLSRNMQSLVARLESKELHTSRDISDLRNHIVSQLSRIDISLDAISKSLAVLHDRIESTVAKVETIESSVNSLLPMKAVSKEAPLGMNWPGSSSEMPVMVEEELPDSPVRTLVRSTSPDITCSETIGAFSNPNLDLASTSGGFMDSQEWENLDSLMKSYLKDM